MRHKKRRNRLGVRKSIEKAMLRNLVLSLFEHEEIRTTLKRAKAAVRVADRMITYAKKGSLHHRRLAFSILRDKKIVTKLFTDLAERYSKRNGGYTRIIKLGFRKGDGAEQVSWQLVDKVAKEKEAAKNTESAEEK